MSESLVMIQGLFWEVLVAHVKLFFYLTLTLLTLFEVVPVCLGRKSTLKKNLPDLARFHVVRGMVLLILGVTLPFLFFFMGIAHGIIDISYLPRFLQIVVLYLFSEFWIYLSHRSAHRYMIPILSKAHRFHHTTTTDLEWVNSKKEHYFVLILFLMVFEVTFFIVFHSSKGVFPVTLGLYLILNAFSHFEVPISIKYLDKVFLFPKDHLRHHTRKGGPYGVTLSVFDSIFKTRGD